MDIFEPPPATPYNFLSLGAGVQSSCLSMMAANGVITPTPDAAIFADTQAEPASVYEWLDKLEEMIACSPYPFPVHRVTHGNLTETSLRVRTSGRSGEHYLSHNVPAYTINSDGSRGNYRRQCTDKHKIGPLTKAVDRMRNKEAATVWIGISWDEIGRMKQSLRRGVTHRFPLIEMRLRRNQCSEWMVERGYPEPPRSACTYCPYHSNREWRRLKTEDQPSWEAAVSYEKSLQATALLIPRLDGIPFLHPDRVPLEDVNLEDDNKNQMQLWNTMQNECEGMCGV